MADSLIWQSPATLKASHLGDVLLFRIATSKTHFFRLGGYQGITGGVVEVAFGGSTEHFPVDHMAWIDPRHIPEKATPDSDHIANAGEMVSMPDSVRLALVKAVLPLEAIKAGGSDKLHTPEVQQAIAEGIEAARSALAHPVQQSGRITAGDLVDAWKEGFDHGVAMGKIDAIQPTESRDTAEDVKPNSASSSRLAGGGVEKSRPESSPAPASGQPDDCRMAFEKWRDAHFPGVQGDFCGWSAWEGFQGAWGVLCESENRLA